MIKIGITGELGSGKSYCSKLFEKLGIPVFYSDDVAKSIMSSNKELKSEIVKEFGNVYDNDILVPKKLSGIVFVKGGEEKLKKLNKISLPYVMNEYQKFCSDNKHHKYTIIESAILYEVNLDKYLDDVIYVYVNEDLRIKRAFERSGISEVEYKQRMKYQLSFEEKLSFSKFIIVNNELDDVNAQVEEINNILNE